jgi:hypothetical protein
MHAGRRQPVAGGGQTSVPWGLSRSVIDSVGPAGAGFARNADYWWLLRAFLRGANGAPDFQFCGHRYARLAAMIIYGIPDEALSNNS